MKHALLVAALVAVSLPAQAAVVGQPFLVIEDDLSGSLLNHFFGVLPSDSLETTLAGTVTATYGWDAMLGQRFELAARLFSDDRLTLGSTVLTGSEVQDSNWGSPFQPGIGPGDLNFLLIVSPDYTYEEVDGELVFTYGGIFSSVPQRVGGFPELEMVVSVYLNGPVPTKVFEYPDDLYPPFDYIEGPLSIERITFGLVDGAPLPPAPVPIPAAGGLLVSGLAGLGIVSRKRRWRKA